MILRAEEWSQSVPQILNRDERAVTSVSATSRNVYIYRFWGMWIQYSMSIYNLYLSLSLSFCFRCPHSFPIEEASQQRPFQQSLLLPVSQRIRATSSEEQCPLTGRKWDPLKSKFLWQHPSPAPPNEIDFLSPSSSLVGWAACGPDWLTAAWCLKHMFSWLKAVGVYSALLCREVSCSSISKCTPCSGINQNDEELQEVQELGVNVTGRSLLGQKSKNR